MLTAVNRGTRAWQALRTSRSCNVRYTSTSSSSNRLFGNTSATEFIASASSAESMPKDIGIPEVVFSGRANVGKSSLIKLVLGRPSLVRSGKTPGQTRSLNFFRVGNVPRQLFVVDGPGYGTRGRPEWGKLFEDYIRSRSTLRRVYILLNTDDGINSYDEEMLRMLEYLHTQEKMPWTYQAVLTKVDKVTSSNKLAQRVAIMRDKIVQVAPSVVSPWIVTSTAKGQHRGIDDIRQSIAEVCGFP